MAKWRCGFEGTLQGRHQATVLRRECRGKRSGQDALAEPDKVFGGTHGGEGGHNEGLVGCNHYGGLCPIAEAALGGLRDGLAHGSKEAHYLT